MHDYSSQVDCCISFWYVVLLANGTIICFDTCIKCRCVVLADYSRYNNTCISFCCVVVSTKCTTIVHKYTVALVSLCGGEY